MKRGVNLLALRDASLDAMGAKGANLLKLKKMKFRVPETYVIPWQTYERYHQGWDLSLLQVEIEARLDSSRKYAVRSSANVEDQFEQSYAGQFQSHLNVQGHEDLVKAVISVWESLESPEAREYGRRRELIERGLRMAVLVQEMVEPLVSGVAFNRNPLTGLRETVVEAVRGPGTALMQEGITPFRWVYHNGQFISSPEEAEVPLEVIEQAVKETRAIARMAKIDVDLEWVWDGHQLYWVQMRRITTLGQARLYSNRISKEMQPGLVKPLIWSINIPLVNGVWIDLLTEMIGPNQLKPFDLARSFYYRAYFNMGLLGEVFETIGFPAESLEIMWGLAPRRSGQKMAFRPSPQVLRLLPRLLWFAWSKWRLSSVLDRKLPELEAAFKAIDLESIPEKAPQELLAGIESLYRLNRDTAYYNVLAPMLSIIYSYLLRTRLGRLGVDFATLDMGVDTPAFHRFDPNHHLKALNRAFQDLPAEGRSRISETPEGDLADEKGFEEYNAKMMELLQDFGHLSDSGNDFSSRPWREDMGMVTRMAVEYVPPAESRSSRESFSSLKIPPLKRWWMGILYRRARQFSLYREHISYIYTLGYGLFRPYYLALGDYFVKMGWLGHKEDIFYLSRDEIEGVFEGTLNPQNPALLAEQRKEEMEEARDLILPELIFGDEAPPPEIPSLRTLTGTATSRGYSQGRVKVVRGFEDFSKVEPGDILVIPYSEVSWTPLFGRAAGVVAESGGMLSHSSIVAREYGIPAVVSVTGALHLEDNTLVRVDGYRGVVSVLAGEGPAAGQEGENDECTAS